LTVYNKDGKEGGQLRVGRKRELRLERSNLGIKK